MGWWNFPHSCLALLCLSEIFKKCIMKKNLPTFLLFLSCIFCAGISLNAQSIQVVPNPTTSSSFNYTQNSNIEALSGYCGSPTVFNNSLVMLYNPSSNSEGSDRVIQLAIYTGGDSLHLIPNPTYELGFQYPQVPTLYHDKLYFIYQNSQYFSQLAEYSSDGTIKLIPTTNYAFTVLDNGIVYNDTLYVGEQTPSGSKILSRLDGNTLVPIGNPNATYYGYQGNAIVFNNNLCINYGNLPIGTHQLAQYDGTNWTIFPNPDTSYYAYQGSPIIYNNQLCMKYYNESNVNQLMVFDGTNPPSLIPNPPNSGNGYQGSPLLFNNDLFMFFNGYLATSGMSIAFYDGSDITLIPNPDNSLNGFINSSGDSMVIYNNNLYGIYETNDGLNYLAQYQADSNTWTLISNPDAGSVYGQLIVFGNNLYLMYHTATGASQLGYFDGNTINLIPNPGGANSASGNIGYTGYPIMWNDTLFMQFGSVPYDHAGNLAFLNESPLPVSLLNLRAKYVAPNKILVRWQTASEHNNKGFEVQRSTDGINFSTIGFLGGAVNSNLLLNYSFIDNSGITGKIFYRIKQIDEDGHGTYSPIVNVDVAHQNIISFSPNPAQSAITIISSVIIKEINLIDMSGQIIKRWSNVLPNGKLYLSDISKGAYFLKFVNDGFEQTHKLIKQ